MSFANSLTPARHWRSRETAVLGMVGCAAVLAVASVSDAMPTLDNEAPAARAASSPMPTSPSATELRDVAPETALALNARIPVTTDPSPAALPFSLGKSSLASRSNALECLTNALYYEAGRESDDGQRAVAQVVLNRVRHPAYPSSVCGVVFQGSTRVTGCQFTFTCDGSMARAPMTSEWRRARKHAWAALNGAVHRAVGQATHYHANYVLPYWASSLAKTHVEGPHIFYRWSGGWGRPAAFTQAYAAREENARGLRLAALSVEHVLPKALAPATGQAAVAALDQLDGVKVAATGQGVTARFSPQAREAVEQIKLTPYVERVEASDNLRRALDGAGPAGIEAKPLGATSPAAATDQPAEKTN